MAMIEYFELAGMDTVEAARLFRDLQADHGQVISVTAKPDGDVTVVTPFDQQTTQRLLYAVGTTISYVSLH